MSDTHKSTMQLVDELLAKEEAVEPKTEAKVEDAVETKDTEVETGATEAAQPTEATDAKESGTAAESDADQPSEKDEPAVEQKKRFSSQEQVDYAFKKEKQKRKALQAKYDQAIAELNKLRSLNMKAEDFKSQEDQVNFLVDMRTAERDAARLQDAIQESQYAEFEQLNNAKIADCFPDPVERERYNSIVAAQGNDLVKYLDEHDKEQTVLAYLDDSPIAPLLTRIFIADRSYLDSILAMRSAHGKERALDQLSDKVEFARKQLAAKPKGTAAPDATIAKKAMPVVGSVTKSDSTKETKTVFDANEYLKQRQSKTKYHHL